MQRSNVLALLLLVIHVHTSDAIARAQASCTKHWDPAVCCEVWPEGKPEEHQEQTCGMKPGEKATWEDAGYGFTPMATEDYDNIPSERTEWCPLDDSNFGHSAHSGQTTRWIVRNNATAAVEVNWVNDQGKEISAGGKEKLVLAPGQTGYINTREGHLFTVREQKDDGAGKLLMVHRVGMIAIKNEFGVPCADGPFARVKRNPEGCPLDCNYLNRGFRNEVGCPVNVFFWNGTHDDFVFQLGSRASGPDAWLWDTKYHYEITYNTHRFRARLPHPTNPSLGRHVFCTSFLTSYVAVRSLTFFNPSLRSLAFFDCVRRLVQEVQIARSDITDCPDVRAPPRKLRHRAAAGEITDVKVTRQGVKVEATTTCRANATHEALLTAEEARKRKELRDHYTYERRGAAPIAAAAVLAASA